MLFNSYTSVSRLINTEPPELLRLWLSEPIDSESVPQLKEGPYSHIGAPNVTLADLVIFSWIRL